MKKLVIVLAVPLALAAGLTVAGVTGGCGLLDTTSGLWISIPSQEFDFDLNANQARDQIQQAINDELQGYSVNLTGATEIPQQVCDPSGTPCVPVPTIQETIEFDLPAQQVDLSDEEDLQKYVQAGKVKDVQVEYIEYNIASNSLNFDLPSVDLYVDAHGAAAITDTSTMYAVVPSIGAGVTGDGTVQFTTNGQATLANYLLGSYMFAMLGVASYTIDTAVTRTIPQGVLQGKVRIGLKFKVDPL